MTFSACAKFGPWAICKISTESLCKLAKDSTKRGRSSVDRIEKEYCNKMKRGGVHKIPVPYVKKTQFDTAQ